MKEIFKEKELRDHSPNFHIHVSVCDRFIYSHDRSAYSAAGKYMDRSWEIAHRQMNMEVGTEAAQFPEKEHINGIFVAGVI